MGDLLPVTRGHRLQYFTIHVPFYGYGHRNTDDLTGDHLSRHRLQYFTIHVPLYGYRHRNSDDLTRGHILQYFTIHVPFYGYGHRNTDDLTGDHLSRHRLQYFTIHVPFYGYGHRNTDDLTGDHLSYQRYCPSLEITDHNISLFMYHSMVTDIATQTTSRETIYHVSATARHARSQITIFHYSCMKLDYSSKVLSTVQQ
ncbi:hypothetical protein J6590_067921 [Homalodisca vitripennis]|nr:hypothetical protein J6590_067921 [Homalodisca vitripennis]